MGNKDISKNFDLIYNKIKTLEKRDYLNIDNIKKERGIYNLFSINIYNYTDLRNLVLEILKKRIYQV